jgi:hypothetical protein
MRMICPASEFSLIDLLQDNHFGLDVAKQQLKFRKRGKSL